jgi:hypothetical protein
MSAEPPVTKIEATGLSDEEFIAQFESCTLPYVHWTHRAHLRVAYCFLKRHGLAEAIPRVTAGIRAYNKSQKIVDTPTSGYHETMTIAWLHLVAAMLARNEPLDGAPAQSLPPSLAFLETQSHLTEKKLLRLYYSRERFMSPEAKYGFVPPDLAPFPVVDHGGAS